MLVLPGEYISVSLRGGERISRIRRSRGSPTDRSMTSCVWQHLAITVDIICSHVDNLLSKGEF